MNMRITSEEECEFCEGTGEVYISCCGDDMSGRDSDLCPSCKEHQGGPEKCEECNGAGYFLVKSFRLYNYI